MVQRKMHGIILSKDRPAQCHLAISSLQLNSPIDNISVLYTSSDDKYTKGYNILKGEFKDVTFIEQNFYREDVLSLVSESYGYTSFFTDDDIFYRHCKRKKNLIYDVFEEQPSLSCFSFRLGLNTIIQDPYNNINAICPDPLFSIKEKELLLWDWQTVPNYTNFGYPCSVDGHLFRTGELKELLLKCQFNNPNQQEIAMNNNRNLLPGIYMSALDLSCVVNTPINRVQETCANRSGEKFGQKQEEMIDKFLEGRRLSLYSIDKDSIIGCHQEINLTWTTT